MLERGKIVTDSRFFVKFFPQILGLFRFQFSPFLSNKPGFGNPSYSRTKYS